MRMELEEAKKLAQKAIDELVKTSTDDIMDDGCDRDDVAQNQRFTKASGAVSRWHKELAEIDIVGISGKTMDIEWKKAWGDTRHCHLPEEKHNHCIKYARWILSL